MQYHFSGDRYMTKGVSEQIPAELVVLMWSFVDRLPNKDYLQIFELREERYKGTIVQKLIHSQERPQYRKEYLLSVDKQIHAKLYVIDDVTHCTMLLVEEY